MQPEFKERLKEAGRLVSSTLAVIKSEWARNRRVASEVLKHLQKFWLALEGIFPGLGRVRCFWWGVLTKYYRDDCFSYAAGLSFWLLISLVPLATLFFKVLVIFLGNQVFFQQTLDTLSSVIPFMPESFLVDALRHSREVDNSMGFTWLVLLFGSYWGINQLDTSLAHVFGVRINKKLQTRKNHILRQFGLLVGGLVLLALVLALLVGGLMRNFFPVPQNVILNNLPILISLVATTLVLQHMPRLHVAFRHAFLGALVSTFLWTVARWGFKIYVDHTFTWGIMYGSLLGIIVGLTFLYYTCAILLLGAQVTAAFYSNKKGN